MNFDMQMLIETLESNTDYCWATLSMRQRGLLISLYQEELGDPVMAVERFEGGDTDDEFPYTKEQLQEDKRLRNEIVDIHAEIAQLKEQGAKRSKIRYRERKIDDLRDEMSGAPMPRSEAEAVAEIAKIVEQRVLEPAQEESAYLAQKITEVGPSDAVASYSERAVATETVLTWFIRHTNLVTRPRGEEPQVTVKSLSDAARSLKRLREQIEEKLMGRTMDTSGALRSAVEAYRRNALIGWLRWDHHGLEVTVQSLQKSVKAHEVLNS